MPFIQAAGHRLEYAWLGPGPKDAPTVVMLHEGLGSVAMWKDFPAAVLAATGLGVLVYSRYGYGRSDPLTAPRGYGFMHDEARIALPEVLTDLGVDAPILLGHSDGGSIALIHAGSPALPGPRPRAVITLAAHVFCEDVTIAGIEDARTAYEQGSLRQGLARYHDDAEGAFRGWNDIWLEPGFREWSIEEFLPAITCPLLALQGADDQYGTAAQLEAIRRGTGGPVETAMLPDCGHGVHVDARAAALAHITEFVDTVRDQEAAA